ncbi:hypothetical protein JCM16303_000621 [Sporobolomyces ruberrimus]
MSKTVPDDEHRLTSSLLRDCFAWIEIDGQPVQVYSKDQAKDGKSDSYIEAIEGKEFVVNWADLRKSRVEDSYTVHVYVDGIKQTGLVTEVDWNFHHKSPEKASWRCAKFEGKRTGENEERPFLFGKLSTTDDDAVACTDEKVIKNLGTICIAYRRVKNVRSITYGNRKDEGEVKPIHERAKRRGSRIRPRMERPGYWLNRRTAPTTRLTAKTTLSKSSNSVTAHVLEGIIPDSPQPSPESTPEPVDGSEDTERQERIARLEKELESLRGGANGGAEAGPSGLKRVKLEATGERDKKKIKQEKGAGLAIKGKKKKEILVLSDSD